MRDTHPYRTASSDGCLVFPHKCPAGLLKVLAANHDTSNNEKIKEMMTMCKRDAEPFSPDRPSFQPLEHGGLRQRSVVWQMGTICSLNQQLEEDEGLSGSLRLGKGFAALRLKLKVIFIFTQAQ